MKKLETLAKTDEDVPKKDSRVHSKKWGPNSKASFKFLYIYLKAEAAY